MSLYIKQIEQLIVLQRVDNEIINLEERLNQAPKEVAEIEEKLSTQQNQKQEIEEKVSILNEQKKKLLKDIENDTTKLKKTKNKLMMTENSREYHAAMREMDNLEKTNRMREEEKAALEEDLQSQNNLLESLHSEIERISEQLEELRENMNKEIKESKTKLKKLEEERQLARQEIPKPILSRYEFIRSRLNNPVIVPVENGVCKGCNISIPPQTFIELQKAEQILNCPNCQRLIFWNNLFAEADLDQKN